mmetsp:Transcript_5541/g.9159  ORF Transcript_5541/g.9159 Transcript_5541/m.9159 type:complete len:89 (-) Transcript_5541:113-379(-)
MVLCFETTCNQISNKDFFLWLEAEDPISIIADPIERVDNFQHKENSRVGHVVPFSQSCSTNQYINQSIAVLRLQEEHKPLTSSRNGLE